MSRISILLAKIMVLLLLSAGSSTAQAPDGQAYVVQADDRLPKLAEKYYDSPLAVSTIIRGTNAKTAEDNSFTAITHPNTLEIGQKLWLPAEPIHEARGELRLRTWVSGSLVGTGVKVTLPFELKGDAHIFVPLQLNGATEPLEVVLDTGSGTSFISPEAARQAGIVPETSMQEFGVAFVDIGVGEAQFADIGVLVGDRHTTDKTSFLSCELQHGLVGQNLLRHAIWQFDYQQRTITISDDLATLDHIAGALRLDLIENSQLVLGPHHYIKVGLGDAEMLGMIDTGRPTVEIRQSEFLAGGNLLPEAFDGGFFETSVKSLRVGALTFTDFPVTLVRNVAVRPNWFFLGTTFLENFIVTLDYPGKSLYLQPYAADAAGIIIRPKMSYGFLGFYRAGDQLAISRLTKPSAAEQAGLQRHDRILQINHDDYSTTTHDRACDLWLRGIDNIYEGPLQIAVERAGKVLNFEVEKAFGP
jgi:hypothetical protein